MFRQTKQQHHKTEEYYYSHNYLNQDDKYVRLPSLEGKVATHSMEENRPNINNRHYQDHSNDKSRDKGGRSSAVRGIQVTSSRNSSSRERKGLATSRSNQKQKESREIKSQTNISQFQSYVESKQSSLQEKSHKKQLHQLCLHYQHKIRESILKNNANSQAQIDELTKVIEDNEDRIDNLIRSLNVLLEKNEKKQQVIERLQERVNSITNYHQQCYQYTLARCQNIQSIFRVIADEIDAQMLQKQAVETKIKAVDLILKDIFMIQRIKAKHQMQFAEEELIKMRQVVGKMDRQLHSLEEMNELRQAFREKEEELKEYIVQMKDIVSSQYRNTCKSQAPQDTYFPNQSKVKQLQSLLQSHKSRLNDLENKKAQLTNLYLTKQQKAQESIWELSNLLNKHERDLQRKEKEVEQYVKYNIEIENKLIESKLKENSLRVQMESICKGLEHSKNDQCDLLIQEKECYKAKFQEIFKHNQYLQEVNAKNKLIMIRQEKELSALAEKIQSQQRQLFELQKTKADIKVKEQYWSDRLKDEKRAYEVQLLRWQQQNNQKQQIISQSSKQILLLQTEVKEVLQLKSKLQMEQSKLQAAYSQLKKDLEQQEMYSEHLQNQNEQLSVSLNEYKEIFSKQSQMFKSTIEKLKLENKQLQKSSIFYKTSKNQFTSYQTNRITFNPNTSIQGDNKQSSQKLLNLQKQFLQLGLKLPVLCQVDCFGYLKSCQSGTYIYDPQKNTIQLTIEQRNAAVQMKIIQLFQ